jgi:hypothetical protein
MSHASQPAPDQDSAAHPRGSTFGRIEIDDRQGRFKRRAKHGASSRASWVHGVLTREPPIVRALARGQGPCSHHNADVPSLRRATLHPAGRVTRLRLG